MANLLHNRYKILQSIGESRTGQTVLAEDTQSPTRQRCVIKPLNAAAYTPERVQQLQAKFSQEATRLEAVSKGHSQIPNLYGYFVEQGIFYWVREWIEGRPLKDFAASPWTEKQVSAFLNSALNALALLHQHNITHLNLKPGNIIVRQADNHPCLVGVGSRALMAIAAEKFVMLRTSGFTAPEHAMGKPIMASDIYSLGMTAIYLLTATSPLKIPTDRQNGRLLWQPLASSVNDRFAGVLTRAIHPSATIRFASAADMLAVLQQSASTPVAKQPQAKQPPKAVSPRPDTPTVITSETVLPAPSTHPPVVEETVVSAPASPPVAPAAAAINPAVSPAVTNPAATNPAVTNPAAANTQRATSSASPPVVKPTSATALVAPAAPTPATPANNVYNQSSTANGLFKGAFFKWWLGLLVGSLGIGALIFFGGNRFSRVATIDASSPDILEDTIDTLEEKVNNNPNDQKATLALVDAYLYGGDIEAADEIVDDLLDEDDTNAGALYQQGRLQFFQSDYTGAIASLEEAVAQDSRNGQAVVMLGRAYQEIGEYDDAEAQFEAALSLPGQQGEAHLNLSYLNNLQGETQAALDAVDAAARFFKGDDRIKIHTQRSAILFDLRERDLAEAEWEAAIALSPRNPEAYVHQSISKFFLGDSEGALANLDQALAINPNFTEAYAMTSLIYLNQGDLESSIEAIDKGIAIDEFSVSTLKIIADVALSIPEPNLEYVLSVIDQALSINPNNPYILNQRCSFMLAVKEIETAIENCTSSIDINPNNVEAYNSRGQAHLAQFDFAGAEADFTRIIEVNEAVGRAPDAAAYAQRAAARTGLEDTEGAKADLDRALEINSEE